MSSPIKSLHDPLYRGDVEWGPSAGGYAEPVLPDLLAHVCCDTAVQNRHGAEGGERVVDPEAGVVQHDLVEHPVPASQLYPDSCGVLQGERHAGHYSTSGEQRVVVAVPWVRGSGLIERVEADPGTERRGRHPRQGQDFSNVLQRLTVQRTLVRLRE